MVRKFTNLVTLPLPLLSFLAIPFVGGSSSTVNFVIFWFIWSALVASHDPLTVEIGGLALIRTLFFLLPALGFLAFDCALPGMSKKLKASGRSQLPLHLGRDKLLHVVAVAVCNVLLSVVVQGGLELLATRLLHLRSLVRVTAMVPLPWNLVKDVVKGYILQGVLRYFIHRHLLHTYASPCQKNHLAWTHSLSFPLSIAAAYDHPMNYLLLSWLPVVLPAYFFRFHVLSLHIITAIVSLQELLVFSGYTVLPLPILLGGMARRQEDHFDSTAAGKPGNFGQLGLLDLFLGTTCADDDDVVADAQQEADRHNVKERVEDKVNAAAGTRRRSNRRGRGRA